MKKTLVLILNYNTPELTTNLFNQLISFEKDDYDLFVLDNGSTRFPNIDDSRIIKLDRNYFFGGGLNKAFSIMLNNEDKYDSLLFLNSDIICHGYNFVRTLRQALINKEFSEYDNTRIVSPCIIQPENQQNHWKQMHNWGSPIIRPVRWVDFQAPMFHQNFIQEVKQFPDELNYGWGSDILTGMICEDLDYKIKVLDYVPIVHLNSKTIEINKMNDYCQIAERNMFKYFQDKDQMEKFNELRYYGENYIPV